MKSFSENEQKEIKQMIDYAVNEKMDTLRMMIDSSVNKHLKNQINRKKKPKDITDKNEGTTSSYSNFGMEAYHYLLMPFLSTIIKSHSDFHAILQKIITNLYFHTEHKENNIVFLPKNSYKTIRILYDNNWHNVDLEETLEKIIRRANDILQHYMVGGDEQVFKNEIGKKKFEQLKNFTDMIDNMEYFQEFREQLFKETEHTIVTTQHIVHKE